RIAEKIRRRLRRTADAGKFRHAVGLKVELEAGLDDRGADRVVAAACAQRRDRALVVAVSEAESVGRECRMMKFRLDDVGHDTTLRSGVTLSAPRCSPIAESMKRAVIGVPS